jgi:uncharacterized protein (TIGR02145 family)
MTLHNRLRKFRILLLCQPLILASHCGTPEYNPNPDYTGQKGQLTDLQGNVYNTIGIGSQIWMVENLNTTIFNDGTPITQVLEDSLWKDIQYPGYCWYNCDSITNRKTFGALYNYYAVEPGKLCPDGWHIPNYAEWRTLSTFLGGINVAGGKLKDYYSSYWQGTNICIPNNLGFVALPGGRRFGINGKFNEIGTRGYWWTSTLKDKYFVFSISMSSSSLNLDTFASNKQDGFSVRCIRDQ